MPILDVSINETRIIHSVWMNPGISRVGLARDLNVNKSTVTKIMNGLLDEGIVHLAQHADVMDTKGRRPTGVFISNELGAILGIEIQPDSWTIVLLDISGKIIASLNKDELENDLGLFQILREALDAGKVLAEKAGRHVLGAGIGLSGQINPYTGVIISSNPLNVHTPLNVHAVLKDEYSFPIVIENDANCCCWSVYLEKKCNRPKNFISVLGEYRSTGIGPEPWARGVKGVGVGIGLVVNDKVMHGEHYATGEFNSVFKEIPNATQFNLSHEEAMTIHEDRHLRQRIVAELARNIALLVNVMDISIVKLFGNFIEEPGEMHQIFECEIQKIWPYQERKQCSIEISDLGRNSVAVGAAGFFIHRTFSLPDLWETQEHSLPSGVELLRSAMKAPLT
jgi:hypothetical protein